MKSLVKQAVWAAILAALVGGCSTSKLASPTASEVPGHPKLIVFAAASLKKSLTDIIREY